MGGPFAVKTCELPADVADRGQGPGRLRRQRASRRRRWSSSPRSRARPWSRSPSRSGSGIRAGRGRRRALRRGRQEAGPAARSRGLVTNTVAQLPGPLAAGPGRTGRGRSRRWHTRSTAAAPQPTAARRPGSRRHAQHEGSRQEPLPLLVPAPGGLIFTVFFLVPTVIAFYFSLTRWTLFDQEFIGLDNFRQFFDEPALVTGLTQHADLRGRDLRAQGRPRHAAGRAADRADHRPRLPALGRLLPGAGQHDRRRPHLPGADGPDRGRDQPGARRRRHRRPGLAGRPEAGRCSRSRSSTSGRASGWPPSSTSPASCRSRASTSRPPRSTAPARGSASGTSPCRWPSRPPSSVIILSLIGGLRSFDLIWAMTQGGPGFTSDVIASVIYKQYQAGFYGLSTAGNVVLFLLVTVIVLPLFWLPQPQGRADACSDQSTATKPNYWLSAVAIVALRGRLPGPVRLHRPDGGQDPAGVGAAGLLLADRVAASCRTSRTCSRPATTS